MMSSEIGFAHALGQHLKLLVRGGESIGNVTRADGRQDRLDLMFSLSAPEHEVKRHMVVGLKAPAVVGKAGEATQVKGLRSRRRR